MVAQGEREIKDGVSRGRRAISRLAKGDAAKKLWLLVRLQGGGDWMRVECTLMQPTPDSEQLDMQGSGQPLQVRGNASMSKKRCPIK